MFQDYELLQSPRYFSSDPGDFENSEDNLDNRALFSGIVQSCEAFPWVEFPKNNLSVFQEPKPSSCTRYLSPKCFIKNPSINSSCHKVSDNMNNSLTPQCKISKRCSCKQECHTSPASCYNAVNNISASLDCLNAKTRPKNNYNLKRRNSFTHRFKQAPCTSLLSELLCDQDQENYQKILEELQECNKSNAQFFTDKFNTYAAETSVKVEDASKRAYYSETELENDRVYFDSFNKKNKKKQQQGQYIAMVSESKENFLETSLSLRHDHTLNVENYQASKQSKKKYCLALTSPRTCSNPFLRSSSFVDLETFRRTLSQLSFSTKNQDLSSLPSLIHFPLESSHKNLSATDCVSASSNSIERSSEIVCADGNSMSLVPLNHYQKQCLASTIELAQTSPSLATGVEENSTYKRRLLTALHQFKYDVGSTLCAYVHNVMNWTGLDGDEFTLESYSASDSNVCLLGTHFTMDSTYSSCCGIEVKNSKQFYKKCKRYERKRTTGLKYFRYIRAESPHRTAKACKSLDPKEITSFRCQQKKDQLRAALNSLTFMSYRRDFAPMYRLLKHQCCVDHDHNILKITSDAGWGCVLRCSQMLLFHTLKRYFLHQLSQCAIFPEKESCSDIYSNRCRRRSNSVWTEKKELYEKDEEDQEGLCRKKELVKVGEKEEGCVQEYDFYSEREDCISCTNSDNATVCLSHQRQSILENYDELYFCDIPTSPYTQKVPVNYTTNFSTTLSNVNASSNKKVHSSFSSSYFENKQAVQESAKIAKKKLFDIENKRHSNKSIMSNLPRPVEMSLLSLFLDLPTPPAEYPFSVYAFVRSAGGGLGWALNLYGSMPVESNILSTLVHRRRKLELASSGSIQCGTNQNKMMRRVVSLSCLHSKHRHSKHVLKKKSSCENFSECSKDYAINKLQAQEDVRESSHVYASNSFRRRCVTQQAINETVLNYQQPTEDTFGTQNETQTIFLGKKPGDWFGPLSASYAIKYLVESCDLTQDDLAVYVNSEGLLNMNEAVGSMLNYQGKKSKIKPPFTSLSNAHSLCDHHVLFDHEKIVCNHRNKRKLTDNNFKEKQVIKRAPLKSIKMIRSHSNFKLRKHNVFFLSGSLKNCGRPKKKVSDLLTKTSRNELENDTALQIMGLNDCDKDWYFINDVCNYSENAIRKSTALQLPELIKREDKSNQKLKCSVSSPVIASFDELHMSSRKILKLLNTQENNECNFANKHKEISNSTSKTKLKQYTKGLLLCFPLTLGKRLTSVQQNALARYFELPWFTGAIGSRHGKKQALYFIGKHEPNKNGPNNSFSLAPSSPPPFITSKSRALKNNSKINYKSGSNLKKRNIYFSRKLKYAEEISKKKLRSFEAFASETKCSFRLKNNKIDLLYLDPHLVQASATNVINSWNTFHSPKIFKTPLSSLDPGLLLAFYCHTMNDLINLAETLSNIACVHKQRAPLLVDYERSSLYDQKTKRLIYKKSGKSFFSPCFSSCFPSNRISRMHHGLVVQETQKYNYCSLTNSKTFFHKRWGVRLIKKYMKRNLKKQYSHNSIKEKTRIFCERRNSDGFVVVNGFDSPRSDYMLLYRRENDAKVVESCGSSSSIKKNPYQQFLCHKYMKKQNENYYQKKIENNCRKNNIISNKIYSLNPHVTRNSQNSDEIIEDVSPVSTTCSSDVLCPACNNSRENLFNLPRKRCCASFKAPCLLKKFSSLLTTQGFLPIIS